MTDVVADFLTRIRNAASAGHETVGVRHSKFIEAIAGVLKREGFISGFSVEQSGVGKTMKIYLKYRGKREPVFSSLQRVSRPGCRKYVSFDKIPSVHSGLGIAILSTSKGVISSRDAAQNNLGGELLCSVW